MAAAATIERAPHVIAEAIPGALRPDETFANIADEAAVWLVEGAPESAEYAASVIVPRVVRVQDLEQEPAVQAEFFRGLGSLAIGRVVERAPESDEQKIVALRDAIELAARGDSTSLAKNIDFAQTEALTNEGIMPDLTITRGADGSFQQDGQRIYDILANSIQFHPGEDANIHDITRAEAINLHAFEQLDQSGYFDQGYVWAAATPVAQGAPGWAVRKYGNFENIDVSWRYIWKEAPGIFKMRVMFMAGVNPEAAEENADAVMTPSQLDSMYQARLDRRHDLSTLGGVYQDLGLPVPESVPEYIRGFLMHRSSFADPEHPEVDMATRYDNKLGPDYYQGRKGVRGDYVADSQKYNEALAGLHSDIPKVVESLIAHRHEFKDDMSAARYMARFVKDQAVDYIIDHPELLPVIGSAIGTAARRAIDKLHKAAKLGLGLAQARAEIHLKARINMCGFDSSSGVEDDRGPLVFECTAGHTNTRPYGGVIDVCKVCGISVMC